MYLIFGIGGVCIGFYFIALSVDGLRPNPGHAPWKLSEEQLKVANRQNQQFLVGSIATILGGLVIIALGLFLIFSG